MNESPRLKEFEKSVKNKFSVFNSLFLNLPFQSVSNIGMLLPLLYQDAKSGLESGQEPLEILDSFFRRHTKIVTEDEKIDFMFRVIQYVERQVVLFDSVEDAAFPKIQKLSNDISLKDLIQLSKTKNKLAAVAEKLDSFSARIVFTAHPTQFYPPSVLDIISKLRALISENNINEIDITLQQLGLTSLLNARKPTPLDEAKNIIYYLRNVYYDSVGQLYSSIKNSAINIDFDNPGIIKLGFWPGGDRDGNPFVTAEITNEVADELRMTLMKCYYHDVKALAQKLTFRGVEEIFANLKAKLYKTMFDPEHPIKYSEIINPLLIAKKVLISDYSSLYIDDLQQLIQKVNIFKTHFAALDIRQDHKVHRSAVEQILIREKKITASVDELPEEELINLLIFGNFQVLPEHLENEVNRDTIKTISVLPSIQEKNGEEGCNRYIISNSEDIFSVLFVYGLFRWCGWEPGALTFDIIPLFETMNGMQTAEQTMHELFQIPAYRRHVERRGNRQTIMLGFSDGTKDGGYFKANWSIFKTKETLTSVCRQYGVQPIFFDGRGGPPARGGGKTHRFYAAQSQNIANHEIQLTIQGQTITSTYGTKEHFIHNCEQLLTAGLIQNLLEAKNDISDQQRMLIEQLSEISFEKYNALKQHEKFISYLENKSTLKYYGKANIGSRPVKRGQKDKLTLNDLRAISFVGSWSQLKQNVPGFYGIGTALQTMVDSGRLTDLQRLFKDVPFFKALISNSMMSLSKCYFELTAYIAKDPEYKEFWNLLYEEYRLSKAMVLLISGYHELMEEEILSRKSIEIREHIVLPLLVIQQYALQKIETNSALISVYEKIVERSLYGNINASRNSA